MRFFQLLFFATLATLAAASAEAQVSRISERPRTTEEIVSRVAIKSNRSVRIVDVQGTRPSYLVEAENADALIPAIANVGADVVRRAAESFASTLFVDGGFVNASASLAANGAMRAGNVWSTTLNMRVSGIPVRGGQCVVTIGAIDGRVQTVRNRLPQGEVGATSASLSADDVAAKIRYAIPRATFENLPSLVYVPVLSGERLELCYETFVRSGAEYWRITHNAITGEVIEQRDLRCYHEPSGGDGSGEPPAAPEAGVSGTLSAKVHPATPYDTIVSMPLPFTRLLINGKEIYADKDGKWSHPTATYPLTVVSSLETELFQVFDEAGFPSLQRNIAFGAADIVWDEDDADIAARSALRSTVDIYSYLKEFDPSYSILDVPLRITVNFADECNAYYTPGDGLTFFQQSNQCSNTALVGDVVYHEFGHHVHHSRYWAAGTWAENRALGEAFADLVSAFRRDNPKIGDGFRSKGSQLRTCNNKVRWPGGVSEDPHATGTIITGAFWDLRKVIGLKTTERLFHEMLKLTPDGPDVTETESVRETFLEVLMATLTVDDDDNDLSNGTPHSDAILAAFEIHKIGFDAFLKLRVETPQPQDTLVASYPLNVRAQYSGALGRLLEDSVIVCYSTDGQSYSSVLAPKTSDERFTALIPKVPAGSVVRYYVTGRSTVSSNYTRHPVSGTYAFLVGYQQKQLDNIESATGWTTEVASDNATTGKWTRAIPYGTYEISGNYVQQDTDHTAIGKYCYVTGSAKSRDVRTDAIVFGKSTLTTPKYDLSKMKSPVVRFWYNYMNLPYFSSGDNVFKIQFSSNGGTSWRQQLLIGDNTEGWQSMILPVPAEFGPTENFLVRFTAQEDFGAVVEAMIDDVEILDVMTTSEPQAGMNEIAAAPFAIVQASATNNTLEVRYTAGSQTPNRVRLIGVDGVARLSEALEAGTSEHKLTLPLPHGIANGIYWVELSDGEERVLWKVTVLR